MKNKKIVIAGGTGFISQAMAKYFGKDNHVVILSRQPVNGHNHKYNHQLAKAVDGYNITYWRWDGEHIEKHWAQELEGADIVINLSGNKREIINSRIHSTYVIGEAIRQTTVPPKVWINGSSATIYRHATNVIDNNRPYSFFDHIRRKWNKCITDLRFGANRESHQNIQQDFSVEVCRRWEKVFFEQRTPFTRKIGLRSAIIPVNGDQMNSCIYIEDLYRIVEWCYDHKEMEGIYNCPV